MQKIPALTSLRFFAALGVLLFHFRPNFEGTAGAIMTRIFEHGYVGVSFFFVLSGFLLASIYLPKETLDSKEFYKKRFFRIAPAYYFALLITVPFLKYQLAEAKGNGLLAERTGDAAMHLGMIQSLVPESSMRLHWLEPSWSISVELFFYLSFPFLILPLRKLQTKGDTIKVALFCAAVGIHALLYWLAKNGSWHLNEVRTAAGDLKAEPTYAMNFALCAWPTFLAGMTAAMILPSLKHSARIGPWSFGGGIAMVAYYFWRDLEVDPVSQTLLLLGMTMIIFGASTSQGFIAKSLSFGPLIVLGEASYSLYLMQRPIDMWLQRGRFFAADTLEFKLIVAVVSIVASVLVWKFIEVPINRWLLRRFSKPRPTS